MIAKALIKKRKAITLQLAQIILKMQSKWLHFSFKMIFIKNNELNTYKTTLVMVYYEIL